jgi:hypothetical protein
VTVRVPADLPDPAVVAVRAALAGAGFVARLRRAVRAAVRADPALAQVRISVSR